MPLYDYTCQQCRNKFDIQIAYADFETVTVHCPNCGSNSVIRCFKAPRVISSDRNRLIIEGGSQTGNASSEEDPRELGRMMRQAQQQSGETMAPEFDEVVGRLESGESVDSIDSDFAAKDPD